MKKLNFCFNFLKKTYELFIKHNGLLFAKSLAFQTLFCFIPAIVTVLFFANYIHLLDQPIIEIKNVLAEQFIPHALQKSLLPQLEEAVSNASGASIFAIAIFLISSFSLITSIQQIYYQFSEQNCQPLVKNQVIVYLLFIIGTLSILLVTGILAYLFSRPVIHDINLPALILKILNFLLVSLMIFSFYAFISPVKFRKRITFLISFIVSVILVFAQKLFVLYLLWFPGYMLVYGTIAFLPLLFFWLYIYWIIFLYGYSVLLVAHKK